MEIFEKSRKNYGSRRLSEALKKENYNLGRHAVRTLMREPGPKAKAGKRFVTTTKADPKKPAFENILNRNFAPGTGKKETVWFSDITYIKTGKGRLYPYALPDRDGRKIIAHGCSESLCAAPAVRCIETAKLTLKNASAVIHHSDRGCQYTADEFVKAAAAGGIKPSVSRKGNCRDNAVAESFFAALKKDRIGKRVYGPGDEAKNEINDFVYGYYNDFRLHSALGYKTPNEVNALF